MNWLDFIPQGPVIAVIGGGGKTGLIDRWERELFAAGRPALATVTTRLGRWQLPHLERVEAAALAEAEAAVTRAGRGERLLLAGPVPAGSRGWNKLAGVPLAWFPRLHQAAAPGLTFLVEADGSAGRPLKAHRPDEPVWPPGEKRVVGVVGLSVLNRPWPGAVHRPELLAGLCPGFAPPPADKPLTPAQAADFILTSWRRFQLDLIFLNQWDALAVAERSLARELAERLRAGGLTALVGSLSQNLIIDHND